MKGGKLIKIGKDRAEVFQKGILFNKVKPRFKDFLILWFLRELGSACVSLNKKTTAKFLMYQRN